MNHLIARAPARPLASPVTKRPLTGYWFTDLVDCAGRSPQQSCPPSRKIVCGVPRSMTILIQVSPGELIDKMTILEVKLEHISDPGKLANVRREHDMIKRTFGENVADLPALAKLIAEPKATNLALWTIEDDIRDHER